MITTFLFLIGLSIILYAYFKRRRQYYQYFEVRGVPHKKPVFELSNLLTVLIKKRSLYEYIKLAYEQFPTARISGMFDLSGPIFVIRDPEILKQLTIKDFDYFENHTPFLDESIHELFGNSLFNLKNQKWRDMRATLSPAFTGSKMRQMFEFVTDCAINMTSHFKNRAKNGEKIDCEMKDIFSRYANDVIATTAFGIKVDSFKEKNNEFYTTGLRMVDFFSSVNIIKFMLLQLIPSLMKILKIEFTDAKSTIFFKQMVLDNMKTRTENDIVRPDMINILMQVKKGQNKIVDDEKCNDGFATVEESNIGKMIIKREWTDNELVAQCFLFFFAGFDSTSTALTFLFYELAINQSIQEKLSTEIAAMNETLNGQSISYDELQKLKYLDMVVSEALRKWPPAAILDRQCEKDYNYDDGELKFTMEKGRCIWLLVYGFHHDPKFFPKPEIFDPERFSDENKDKIVPYSYIPFGIGPRNCIGSRFALMELKVITYYLLLNFKFIPNARTQIPLQLAKTAVNVRSERGVELELSLRHN